MNRLPLFADQVLAFFGSLSISSALPRGVNVLNPYLNLEVMDLCKQFYHQYYHDSSPRKMILGINPGRLGSGLTGIPFTDPIRLENNCGIENKFQKKAELSSTFIYEMIAAAGGNEKFYSTFYFSSISPLGFTKKGKNLNYYDEPPLQKKLEPFILSCMQAQLNFGIDRSVAYCLGEGKNFKFFQQLNTRHKFFKEIIPLAHPRFIMQYKSKSKSTYIQRYLNLLNINPEGDAS